MFAVLSDIHSNLEALQAVLEFLYQKNITQIYCTGDLVGYGPNPNEVIEIIRQRKIPCCLGNHDAAVINKTSIAYFNNYASTAVLWTKERITTENLLFLQTLPYQIELDDYLLVHSSPSEPPAWKYIFSLYDAEEEFSFFQQKVCFVGHSHVPGIFSDKMKQLHSKNVELTRGEKYVINVGSVGQPRDGDPRACVLLFDEEKYIASIHRIGYDVDRVKWKIIQAGLPEYLGIRLTSGR